ncbi:MAG: hypothetical protein C3L25_13300 [Candidatus Sedimenticola endophacoides]|nr:MAG: hypothetical protein C3L26_13395 [Candidatus Sedimenticola endophacoides]PUE00808.1 MAG: hypothetical protein C3L25_13300 [Candidatus Sedimenticola endophacoides]
MLQCAGRSRDERRTVGAVTAVALASRFWGLGCPKIFHEVATLLFGFELGYLPSHPSIGVSLHPSNLFGRHFAILGQSGAGKSWSVTSTIQRALKAMPNAHIILLDLHGEYVWKDSRGNVSSAFQEGVYRYLDARQLEIPYWLLTYSELVDLLIDRDDEGSSTQMAFLREVLLASRRKANKDLKGAHISIDSPALTAMESEAKAVSPR